MNCKTLLKLSLLSGVFFGAIHANAQMVGTDVFLKGKYLEVGIGHLGYYGSDSTSPSGYHPHVPSDTTHRLGFVADPAMDGWTVGTPPYMGDYFIPGFPFEGWDIQLGSSTRCQGYNTGSAHSTFLTTGGLTGIGSNTAYTASGSTVSGTWEGIFDSLTITQVTTLDTNELYFSVEVTLTNHSTSPVDDIYYFRSVDPDNDETWPGGAFNTNNMINYQNPDSTGVSAVTATGTSSSAPPLTLGTTDTASRAVIYNLWPIDTPQNLASVYAENTSIAGGSFYDAGGAHNGDIAIGLIMHVAHLATVDSAGDSVLRVTSMAARHPANTATFTYFYAFTSQAVDSAIAHANATTGTVPSLAIKNVNTVADVKVYPNPSKDMINVTGLTAGDNVTLYDMVGRNMGQNWTAGGQRINSFNYNNVPAGAYLLTVSDANGNVKARVSVRKM